MAAPKGNKNNFKPVKASAKIHIRCLEADKARWTALAAAQGLNLSQWITIQLNCVDNTK
jgi:hypothetical protein